jgi:predicted outer membrane protein
MRVLAFAAAFGLGIAVAGASAQTISDAQIAHIVVTANQVDIDAGKLAAARATSPEVKRFGELKALLVKVRPAFVAHLEHARKIQSSVGR